MDAPTLDCDRAIRMVQRAVREAAREAFWIRARLHHYSRLEDGSDHWHFVLSEVSPPVNRLPAELHCRLWSGLALTVFETLILSSGPVARTGSIAQWLVKPRVTYAAGLIWEIHGVRDIDPMTLPSVNLDLFDPDALSALLGDLPDRNLADLQTGHHP